MTIQILYEDDFVLGLNKPSGLMVHSDGRGEEKTLVDWINENYPDLSEVGEEQILQNGQKIKRPGIVHRLDRETSGVILVAKTKEAHAFLKEQFQNRKVEKIYNAVVWGSFGKDKLSGVIDKPIGRSSTDFRRWSAEHGAKGELREAVTEYRVLLPHPGLRLDPPLDHGREDRKRQEFSYLEVRPKTGRTHQIRVHLKAISHPVVCDRVYGAKNICDGSDKCIGFSRLALHAFSIKIELPNRTHILIEAPLPSEFEEAKNILKS